MLEMDKKSDRLIKLLKTDIVKITYRKIKGELREARGTLRKDLVPKPKKPVGDALKKGLEKMAKKHKTLPEHLILYYDLDKKDFRSFFKRRLLKFEIEKTKDDKKTSKKKS